MTKVVNIKSGEKYDVYCGRAGHGQNGYFGNPFIIGKDGTREEVIEKFKVFFRTRLYDDIEFKNRILSLRNKTLGCFCKPLSCHCDVIKEYLDNLSNKVIIAGSRTIDNYKLVEHCINETIKQNNLRIDEIVCGEANGVDSCGKEYGINNNVEIKSFPAKWNIYGKSAGYKRNEEMAKYSSHLILIWDGISKGSKHMKNLAEKYNLEIYEWIFNT